MFHIPGYELIHKGFRCTKHEGLIVYINEKYSYKRRNLYDKSDVWEGLFIDVNGHNLSKTLTIGNMYKPPHDNYNNENIEKFIDEISPIIDIIQKENSYVAIVGDFNINLLQVNEREKYAEFLDLMCTNIENYRNMCATRFNIGSFIICYIYEWHTDCEWTSQLYFIRWWYDIDQHVIYVYTGSKSWCKPYVIFNQFRTV